ncbi:MAG TPA: arginine--tRNA ligase [Ardenticatenaceae bacterium]|jgi:arginyl-tRNA synthetase
MIQDQLAAHIQQAIAAAQSAGALPAFDWDNEVVMDRPRNAEHGDFATPVALKLQKLAGTKPRAVAEAIVAHLPTGDLIHAAEIAGPGFINLRLNPAWLTSQLDTILQAGPAYADLDIGQGRKTQVEFVSANPTGPLTVGHARGAILGDTLATLLQAAGYEVVREYYFNNAGLQMENLGESLQIRYLQLLGIEREIVPGRHYEGDYMQWIAATLLAFHGDTWRDQSRDAFKGLAVETIFANIRHTLRRLRIEFDVYFNENSLYENGAVEEVIEDLKARDWLYFHEGAWWFKATTFGKEKDRVFVRSNGMPTYRVPDIAYHRDKLRRFDKIVDIFGSDHKDAIPDVVDALTALGEENTASIGVLLHQFTTLVRDGEEVKMSTRRANYVTLDELIDEVGPDAVRYFMLAYSPTSQMTFDINQAKSKQENENPVIYIQYAHARAVGILDREAPKRNIAYNPDASTLPLTHEAERDLINEMLRLREVVAKVEQTLEPHHVAYYARDLAASFNNFYDKCPVLRTDVPPDVQQARLKLVAAARVALARTLQLMSMNAPDEITREEEQTIQN